MKKVILLVIIAFAMCMPLPNHAAMVQFIHNAPTENLDFYINDQLQFPNMIFRHGTPFILIPDGDWTLQIAAVGATEFLASFPIFLEEDSTYIYMVGGEKDNLQLFTQTHHHMYADLEAHIGFTFVHGAIEEQAVQMSVQEQTVFDELPFGVFSPFMNVTAEKFEIAIERPSDQKALIANRMNFQFWKGGSAVIFTSGYSDGREPRLKTYAILSNGNSFPLEEIPLSDDHRKVKIQLIQNAVDKVFDLYLNDELFVNNFRFSDATTFLDFPKDEYFSIGVAASDSRSYLDITEFFTFKLESELPYIFFLNSTEDGGLTLMQIRDEVPENEITSSISLSFSQGAFQLPALDVYIDRQKRYSNVDHWDITDFQTLPSRPFRIDLTPTGQPENIMYSYRANLKAWRGQSGIFYTAGFVEGRSPNLKLQIVFPDTTFAITAIDASNGNEVEDRSEEISSSEPQIFITHVTPQLEGFINLTNEATVQLSILNAEGKMVWNQNSTFYIAGRHFFKFKTDQLPTGIYFLKGYIGKEIITEKIVLP